MFSRRQIVAGAGAGAALLGAPGILRAQTASYFTGYPFSLGVAAGDPSPDGFVLWTRLAPDPLVPHAGMPMTPFEVDWLVATDARMEKLVAKGTALARPELGHAVHVEVTGLAPDTPYYYQFRLPGDKSSRGRARTFPLPHATPARLRFGVAGCQNYQAGYYDAFRHLAAEDVAFVFHYGDYIYEDRGTNEHVNRDQETEVRVRRHIGQACYDLADYRQRYAQYKLDSDLQAAHASAAWFCSFDDHDVTDDWAGTDQPAHAPADAFLLRREAAFQAWYENMPVRSAMLPRGPDMAGTFRIADYGDLVRAHFLDTRQFRTPEPCGGSFKPICPGTTDPAARMMSAQEESWLAANLARPGTRWNAILQQVMMMAIDRRTRSEPAEIRNMDGWAGYEAPRRRMLGHLRGLGDAIVISGDEHQNYAGLLTDGDRAVAVEFVGTSISSDGDGSELRAGGDRILAENPEIKLLNNRRGYVVCDVGRDDWRTDFMVLDRVSTPGGALSKRASATVERGKADVHIA